MGLCKILSGSVPKQTCPCVGLPSGGDPSRLEGRKVITLKKETLIDCRSCGALGQVCFPRWGVLLAGTMVAAATKNRHLLRRMHCKAPRLNVRRTRRREVNWPCDRFGCSDRLVTLSDTAGVVSGEIVSDRSRRSQDTGVVSGEILGDRDRRDPRTGS